MDYHGSTSNQHAPAMRSRSAEGRPSAQRSARNNPSAASFASPVADRSRYADAMLCKLCNCPAKSITTLVLRVAQTSNGSPPTRHRFMSVAATVPSHNSSLEKYTKHPYLCNLLSTHGWRRRHDHDMDSTFYYSPFIFEALGFPKSCLSSYDFDVASHAFEPSGNDTFTYYLKLVDSRTSPKL